MKRLIVMLLAAAMLMCGFNAFAENETLDMEHNTAVVYLDGEMYSFDFEAIDDSEEEGMLASFIADDGSIMVVILTRGMTTGTYYEAAEQEEEMFCVGVMLDDGVIFTSTCADANFENGDYCDVAMSAFNEDGWYQGVAIGTLMADESDKTYEIVMAFDFMADAAADDDSEQYILDQTGEDALVDEQDEDYFTANMAEVNIGGDIYSFELFNTDTESGAFAIYNCDDTGCQFAIAVDPNFEPGAYYNGEVESDVFYCAFIDENGMTYFGECAQTQSEEFAACDVVLVSSGDDGLYQVGFVGEIMNAESGDVLSIAGFADFTVE